MDGPVQNELAALMAAAQSGDSRAYARVLKACVPIAAATARRTGVRPDRVDDVVQDVLLTIHRALPTYDPARPFEPWLRAIAARRAIDSLRLHGRHGAREVQDEDAYMAHAEQGPDAEQSASRQDDAARLRAAVATLPPLQRQAVELLALQERSLDEASAQTGRTKGALKVNLHRALRALRTRVGRDADV
jgi:RNA polymerase sigma-70 factor (ECF subfamily)